MEQLHLLCETKKKGVSMMYRLDVRVIWLQHNSPSCVKRVDFFNVINSEVFDLGRLEKWQYNW